MLAWLLLVLMVGSWVAVAVWVNVRVRVPSGDISRLTVGIFISGAAANLGTAEDVEYPPLGSKVITVTQGLSVAQRGTPTIVLEPLEVVTSGCRWRGAVVLSVYAGRTLQLRLYETDAVWTVLHEESDVDYWTCGGHVVVTADTDRLLWLTGDGGRGEGQGTLWQWTQPHLSPTVVSTGWWRPQGLAWDQFDQVVWILDASPSVPVLSLFRQTERQAMAPPQTASGLYVYQGTAFTEELGTDHPLLTLEQGTREVQMWQRGATAWAPVISAPSAVVCLGEGPNLEPRMGTSDGQVLQWTRV